MKFSIFQETRIGGRSSNQDRIVYCYSKESLMMVVADGMGGHKHGELAAQLTVQYMTKLFQKMARPLVEDPFHFLDDAIYGAHRIIQNHAFDKMLADTPRTTVVACIVQEGAAYWAHVGDSRLYFIHNEKLTSRTRDHSRVQRLLDQGAITEEEAAKHPDRNKIFNCLGGEQPPKVELSSRVRLSNGDILALCTDGVWGYFSDDDFSQALCLGAIAETTPRLMDRAERLGQGHGDNLSAIVMQWKEETSVENPFTISTMSMPEDGFTTGQEGSHTNQALKPLDDYEIERTISEIKASIKKFNANIK